MDGTQATPQRTAAWHQHRDGRITGSRVGSILGLNKYATRADVMREMVRAHMGAPREFEGNEATEWGTTHEPIALADYAFNSPHPVVETGLHVHPDHDWLAASPDGLVGADGMVECKAPFRARYQTAAEKPEYLSQMQLQMAATSRKWCDFIIWREGEDLIVERIGFDSTWLPRVLPELEAFIAEYRATIADPERAKPHLADQVRSDTHWRKAAERWLIAKASAAAAAEAEQVARDELLALAPAGAKGCGVQVIRSERAGSIAYAKALKDFAPDAELSAYTGKPSTVLTVKECKA